MDQRPKQVRICAYSACNEHYAGVTIVSLLSLKKWNPEVDLYIITDKLTRETKKHALGLNIGIIEHHSSIFHANKGQYPANCFDVFYGPEIFADKGYSHCIYVDGDIYCNRAIDIDWGNIMTYAGVSYGSIPSILKQDTLRILSRWGIKQYPCYRIQTGVLLFNNAYARKVGLAKRVERIYTECIRINARRFGDDSLFSVYQCLYQDEPPSLLGNEYNLIIENRTNNILKWRTILQGYIHKAVFVHFTLASPKPWQLSKQYPCYTLLFFAIKWNQRLLDELDDKQLRYFFSGHYYLLKKTRTRFYWWGDKNVGDLIAHYVLAKTSYNEKLSNLRVNEKTIQRCLCFDELRRRASFIARLLMIFDGITRYAFGINQYIMSAGSIMRLSSSYASIYGSGVRDSNQEFVPGMNLVVRGPITRQRVLDQGGCCPPVYGDPGLLINQFYKPKPTTIRYKLGICPHFSEYTTVLQLYKDRSDVLIIDMGCGDLENVLDHLSSCSKVMSSSLHGIVFCHSYGIPVRWIKFSDSIKGDDTKFHDYFKGIGLADESPIDARYYKQIDVDYYYDHINTLNITIDKARLIDQMPFDTKGVRRSALFPFARLFNLNVVSF